MTPCTCGCQSCCPPTKPPVEKPLVFGVHRMPAKDAETAPAWPSLGKHRAQLWRRTVARVRRVE